MIRRSILTGVLLSATAFYTIASATPVSLNPGDVQITNKSTNVLSFRLMVDLSKPTASTGLLSPNDYRVLTNGAIGQPTTTYKVQYLTSAKNAQWTDITNTVGGISYDAKYSYKLNCSESSCKMIN